MRKRMQWVWMGSVLLGCSLEHGARGDACARTSECQLLLACIGGVCTDDLQSVAEQSTVPDLVRDAGAPQAAADAAAGADAAAIGVDAAGADAAATGVDAAADE